MNKHQGRALYVKKKLDKILGLNQDKNNTDTDLITMRTPAKGLTGHLLISVSHPIIKSFVGKDNIAVRVESYKRKKVNFKAQPRGEVLNIVSDDDNKNEKENEIIDRFWVVSSYLSGNGRPKEKMINRDRIYLEQFESLNKEDREKEYKNIKKQYFSL